MSTPSQQLLDLQNSMRDLETRSAFQEDTINQLNSVIIEQQQMIDRINLNIEALRGEIQPSQSEQASIDNVVDDKPPHY